MRTKWIYSGKLIWDVLCFFPLQNFNIEALTHKLLIRWWQVGPYFRHWSLIGTFWKNAQNQSLFGPYFRKKSLIFQSSSELLIPYLFILACVIFIKSVWMPAIVFYKKGNYIGSLTQLPPDWQLQNVRSLFGTYFSKKWSLFGPYLVLIWCPFGPCLVPIWSLFGPYWGLFPTET